MLIYKITNNINNKIYIGLTTVSLEERWKNHKTQARIDNQKPLYRAIRKYGIENFSIEHIDTAHSMEELGEKERYYISLYNSQVPNGYNITAGGEHNQNDANPRARLSENDIKDIRIEYAKNKIGASECYKKYKDRISYSAFEKIWEGRTWKSVSPEVYSAENRILHRTISKSMPGESNPNGVSDIDIFNARLYYTSHTLEDTYKKFGSAYSTKDSFRSALTHGYKNVPIYKKSKDNWYYKGEQVLFNPVSTISGTGE